MILVLRALGVGDLAAGVPRTAGRALSLTGLTELFDTYPDAEAAAAGLR